MAQKLSSLHLILSGLLLLTLLCSPAAAEMREPAPQFSIQSLDHETFTNGSLAGRVVLLQFWTTRCPSCRRDQPAVDNVEAAFAGKGLVVLAIAVGEPESTVRAYLEENPRVGEVAVNQNSSLAARFAVPHDYPYYILIDRAGAIVGEQGGGGGEGSLRRLLARAGLRSAPERPQSGQQQESTDGGSGGPQLLEAPWTSQVGSSKPMPKTIFVFANGEQLEADSYLIRPGFVDVTVDGLRRQVPLNSLDIQKTIAVNHERGVDLKFPANKSEVFLAF